MDVPNILLSERKKYSTCEKLCTSERFINVLESSEVISILDFCFNARFFNFN